MSSRRLASLTLILLIAACGGGAGSSASGPPSPVPSTIPSTTAGASATASAPASARSNPWLTFVMFGDSWPYGAHCDGCVPYPGLLKDAYAAATGQAVNLVNDTTNGGTAQELAARMQTEPSIRDDIGGADIIVISIGANDLEPAFSAWMAGTCGGADKLDCFRDEAAALGVAYDGMLTEIDALRGGRPTAVRMVTTSNEFLADAGLIAGFGADFGKTGGVAITTMNRDAECAAAAAHHAACVDLGLALNGPDLLIPLDVNTQDAMQKVADTIAAIGLEELGP